MAKKRKKNKDKAWSKASERGQKSTLDVHKLSTAGLIRLMRAGTSPANKFTILQSAPKPLLFSTPNRKGTKPLTPSKFRFSTPENGIDTTKLITPQGSTLEPSRIITTDTGVVKIFLSSDKTISQKINIPAKPKPWLENCPVPEATLNDFKPLAVTKVKIDAIKKVCAERKRLGKCPRGKGQNQVMKIPANKALLKAGFDVAKGTGQWLHLDSYSFRGDDGQTADNLVLGTRQANAAMELVNRAIESLIHEEIGAPATLYISNIPSWVIGYEKCRLAESITTSIKDDSGHSLEITFDTLSISPVCETDIEPIKKLIYETFKIKPLVRNNSLPLQNLSSAFDDVVSPAKLLTPRKKRY